MSILSYMNKKTAKGIAKKMKHSYETIQSIDPKIKKKDLYIKSLMQRPGYYDRSIAESFYREDDDYRDFVLTLIVNELEVIEMRDFIDAVNEVIPKDY